MAVPIHIFLLEDNPARLGRMLTALARIFPSSSVHFESDAAIANAYIAEHQHEIDLISLDHDLDSVPRPDDPPGTDHGCGRDVSKFLMRRPATCPVIVHTTNEHAGTAMVMDLHEGKWHVVRVYPHHDNDWVDADWVHALENLVAAGWVTK